MTAIIPALRVQGSAAFVFSEPTPRFTYTGVELYADDDKAIAWIQRDGRPLHRIVFRHRDAIAAANVLMRALAGHEFDEVLDQSRIVCSACDGTGWHKGHDGEVIDCPSCQGLGYPVEREVMA